MKHASADRYVSDDERVEEIGRESETLTVDKEKSRSVSARGDSKIRLTSAGGSIEGSPEVLSLNIIDGRGEAGYEYLRV